MVISPTTATIRWYRPGQHAKVLQLLKQLLPLSSATRATDGTLALALRAYIALLMGCVAKATVLAATSSCCIVACNNYCNN